MRKLFDRIKSIGFMGLFPWLWLVFAYIWEAVYQIIHGREVLDADLAAEMVLSDLLNKEHSILSKNWFYSTELRVFESQWFYRLGLLVFPNNWHAARVFATMIMLGVLAALVIIAARMLGFRKIAPWAAAVLMCPFGRFWLVYSTYGTYYLIYTGFSLMTVIAIAGIIKGGKPITVKNAGFYLLGIFAGLASGLNGIKQTLFFFAPLVIAALILFLSAMFERGEKIKKEKDIVSVCGKELSIFCVSVFFTVFNLAGYLINSRILVSKYSFTDFGQTNWTGEPQTRLYDVIVDFLSLFGYESGGKVLSIGGIISGIGLMFGFVVIASIAFLMSAFKRLSMAEKFLLLINVSTLAFCSLVFCYIDVYQSFHWLYHVYYWLPLMPFLILAVLVTIGRLSEGFLPGLKTLSYAGCILGAALVTLVSWNTLKKEVFDPLFGYKGYVEAADFLVENDLTQGYAMFWSSDVLRELSNGKVETWTVTNPDIYILHEWLQEKTHLTEDPEGKVFFLMDADPALLGEHYAESAFIQNGNCREVYAEGTIHIYEFDSAESFKNSGVQY